MIKSVNWQNNLKYEIKSHNYDTKPQLWYKTWKLTKSQSYHILSNNCEIKPQLWDKSHNYDKK